MNCVIELRAFYSKRSHLSVINSIAGDRGTGAASGRCAVVQLVDLAQIDGREGDSEKCHIERRQIEFSNLCPILSAPALFGLIVFWPEPEKAYGP